MTKIKLCGLTRPEEIGAANRLRPDYIGFVFSQKSRRYIPPERAGELRKQLDPDIRTVGVFVREDPEIVARLLSEGIIDLAQLHGGENDAYIRRLRDLTDKPLLQAFRIDGPDDLDRAGESPADYILLDSGTGGTGQAFDWSLLRNFGRPYFLAGGLRPDNVAEALRKLHPYAVDVSSGIETDGVKDPEKMNAFVEAVWSASGKDE